MSETNEETAPLIQDIESNTEQPSQFTKLQVLGVVIGLRTRDRCLLIIYMISALTLVSVLFFFIGLVATGFRNGGRPGDHKPLNVIMMVSDGFGPASQVLARNFIQRKKNLPVSFQLPLDTILVGSSRTRSSSSLVTDSAAGATAFACGLKSYNGAIGVDSKGVPCGFIKR